jgi:trehalose 6-phosphate phosphatase
MADAAEQFSRIDLNTHALLFDVDGTLLDIAPRPDQVAVPPALIETLRRLNERSRGAVAFISGRKIAVLDALFRPLTLAAVGVHGAEMRTVPGSIERLVEPLPVLMRQQAAEAAAVLGILIEDKEIAVTLHFRQAPEKEAAVEALAARLRDRFAGEALEIARNKMVVELVRRGVNKGAGISALMQRPPFKGRRPIFVGDDRTDEHGFDVMPQFKGAAYSIGREYPGLAGIFESAAAFRATLQALAAR